MSSLSFLLLSVDVYVCQHPLFPSHTPHFLAPSISLSPSFPLHTPPSLCLCASSQCQWKVLLSACISNHSPSRPNYGHTFNVWGQSRTCLAYKAAHKGNISLARWLTLTLVVILSHTHWSTSIYLSVYLRQHSRTVLLTCPEITSLWF